MTSPVRQPDPDAGRRAKAAERQRTCRDRKLRGVKPILIEVPIDALKALAVAGENLTKIRTGATRTTTLRIAGNSKPSVWLTKKPTN